MRTLLATAAAAAMLLPTTASANDNTAGVVGTGFLVGGFVASGMGGLVTDLGTGMSLATGNPALRSWGIASAVTGAANLGYGTFFLIGALQPSNCSGRFCMDFRSEFAVLAGVSGALGISNAVLAGIALSRKQAPGDTARVPFSILPATLRDARGREAPGLWVTGQF
jgi:hypothetical protein